MGKKVRVRISEQDLSALIAKNLFGGDTDNIVSNLLKKLTGQDTEKKDDEVSDKKPVSQTAGEFTQLDLNKSEDYNAYKEIADKFISSRSSNLLGIRGSMLADAAKNAQNKFGKYVPVELALGQLAIEGGFSKNPNARPIKTKNPYNVGNTDSGANVQHSSVQSGIQTYYDLIAKNYLSGSKTASDLLNNFVNKNGNRYASSGSYEDKVSQIANQVKSMGEPVYAAITKDSKSANV